MKASSSALAPLLAAPSRVAPLGYFSTGVGIVRLSHHREPFDGAQLGVVLAHGSDWSPQPLTLHRNRAPQQLDPVPAWFSNDYDHHASVAVGDLSGNGYDDVVVAVMAGKDRHVRGGGVKVYLGSARGLDPNPVWIARGFAAFGVALADLRGVGRLDVIAGSLWDGGTLHRPERRGADYFDGALRILENEGGEGGAPHFRERRIEHAAARGSAEARAADMDGDGRFELVCAGARSAVLYARDDGDGRWEPESAWRSQESHHFSFSARAFLHPSHACRMLLASSRGLFSMSQLEGASLAEARAAVLVHAPQRDQSRAAALQVLAPQDPAEVPAGLALVHGPGGSLHLAVGYLSGDASLVRGAPVRLYASQPEPAAPFAPTPQTLPGGRLMAAGLAARAGTVEGHEATLRRRVAHARGQQVFTFAPHELGEVVAVHVCLPGSEVQIYERPSSTRKQPCYLTASGEDWLSLTPRLPPGAELIVHHRRTSATALLAASSAAWPPIGASMQWLCGEAGVRAPRRTQPSGQPLAGELERALREQPPANDNAQAGDPG